MSNSEFDRDQLSGSTIEESDAHRLQVQKSYLAQYKKQEHAIGSEIIVEGEYKHPKSIFGETLGTDPHRVVLKMVPVISRLNTVLLIPDLGSPDAKNVVKIAEVRKNQRELRKLDDIAA